jgi:hypothetical protein
MKKTTHLILGLLVLAGLAACAPISEPEVVEPAPVASAPAAEPEPTSIEEDPSAGQPAGVAKFGETVSWPEGVEITLSQPKAYTLGEWDIISNDFPAHFVTTVTLKNTGMEKYDPSGVYLSASSGGVQGEDIWIDGVMAPTTTVMPGKSVSWNVAFGVDDLADVTVDVDPGIEYQPWFTYETMPAVVTYVGGVQ